jgi:hypothetical protein
VRRKIIILDDSFRVMMWHISTRYLSKAQTDAGSKTSCHVRGRVGQGAMFKASCCARVRVGQLNLLLQKRTLRSEQPVVFWRRKL